MKSQIFHLYLGQLLGLSCDLTVSLKFVFKL